MFLRVENSVHCCCDIPGVTGRLIEFGMLLHGPGPGTGTRPDHSYSECLQCHISCTIEYIRQNFRLLNLESSDHVQNSGRNCVGKAQCFVGHSIPFAVAAREGIREEKG